LDGLIIEDEDTTILRNVWRHLLNGQVSHHRRSKSLAALFQ